MYNYLEKEKDYVKLLWENNHVYINIVIPVYLFNLVISRYDSFVVPAFTKWMYAHLFGFLIIKGEIDYDRD